MENLTSKILTTMLIWAITLNCAVNTAVSHPSSNSHNPAKARLNLNSPETYKAFSLPRGGMVRISSTPEFEQVAKLVTSTVKETHLALEEMFGPINSISVEVKLLPENVFLVSTGAPSWTNALFYEGTIIIPVKKEKINPDDFIRSIKHEFTHAAIYNLTKGNAPGWIDEGFAQLIEGSVHPALYKALNKWMDNNHPVPLYMLQNGFTKLEQKYVVPAYAQSLWAARFLVGQYGLHKTRNYFNELGKNNKRSFVKAFGLSELEFEQQLACSLTNPICLKAPENCTVCAVNKRL